MEKMSISFSRVSCQRGGSFTFKFAIFQLTIFVVLLIVLDNSNSVASHECSTKELRYVVIMHRHGDRTPLFDYEADPYRGHKWRGGKGALTPKGTQQLCDLGLTLQSRYSSLLQKDGKYSPKNIRVVSSSVKRCVHSAYSILSCMTSRRENGHLIFQYDPVEFTIIPAKLDSTLRQCRPCPRFKAMLKGMLKRPEMGTALYKFNKNHARLYKYLSKHTGEKIKNVDQIAKIYDTLLTEQDNNLELPFWTKSIFPVHLRKTAERSILLRTENDYMARIRGGASVTAVMEELLRAKETHTQKVEIFSAHDSTLVNLLNAIGMLSQTTPTPDYGAALAFELYYGCGEWFIEIVYFSNATDRIPKKLNIPKCSSRCKLDDFRKSIDNVWLTQEQYDAACKL